MTEAANARILLGRVGEGSAPGVQRVLVDRLWPRGVRKERAEWAVWLKDVAPSTQLRKWYHHEPDLWEEFRSRYRAELEDPPQRAALARLAVMLADGPVILLTHSRHVERSHAEVLAEVLAEHVRDA